MKTCKSRKRREEKCYMAHGSSRGSSRSGDSRGSHMSKVSRNSQELGKSNSDPFDASISNSDLENDISYDELIECYEHMCKQFKTVKHQNKKLKENLEKNEMIIDNAQAFYEENETLKMENEKLEKEVKNYEIKFSKLREDHDHVESENSDLKNQNEKLIDHNENLKFDNDQLIKQISNMAHDHQIKEKCNQLIEENNHLKKKIEGLYHNRPLNDEWNNAKQKIADLKNQIVQSEIEKNKIQNGLDVMKSQLLTSKIEIVALKVEKKKLNKKAPNRKNHVSIENQKKKMEKKTRVYRVSTTPPEAQNVSRKSPTPHHAKRYQRVLSPSSQPKGDQRYSKRSQRFQQMQSHYGKLQLWKKKKLVKAAEQGRPMTLVMMRPLTVEGMLSELGLGSEDLVIISDRSDEDSFGKLVGALEPLAPAIASKGGASSASEWALVVAGEAPSTTATEESTPELMPTSVMTPEMATVGATIEAALEPPLMTGAVEMGQSEEHAFSADCGKAGSLRGASASEAEGLEGVAASVATKQEVEEAVLTFEQAIGATENKTGSEEDYSPLSRVLKARTPVQPTEADLEAALAHLRAGSPV
ncbi:hypothetical protein Taro_025295 [Colocasia esculenta]|uniref:Uncharacterized protein n=1 Tax=Colocasia esculenta TaxID=4460 RepID=A0A843V927_COLES|nr:hypothetical protein [Colocasia esculenta]